MQARSSLEREGWAPGSRRGAGRSAHVGEDEIFETDGFNDPTGLKDGTVGTNDQHALSVGVTRFDDDLSCGGVGVARTNETMMGRQ